MFSASVTRAVARRAALYVRTPTVQRTAWSPVASVMVGSNSQVMGAVAAPVPATQHLQLVRTLRTTSAAAATDNAAFLNPFGKAHTLRSLFHVSTYTLAVLVPAGVIIGGTPQTIADFALALAIPFHFHVGMRSVILDYVKPDSVARMAIAALAACTVLTAVSLLALNMNDVGIIGGVGLLWKAPAPASAPAVADADRVVALDDDEEKVE